MLTVISPPADLKPDFRHPHDFLRRRSTSRTRYGSQPPVEQSTSAPHSSLEMSGHHRGLPPPAAMTLPDPIRPGTGGPGGPREYTAHLPPPPSQSQVPEDAMREWLVAKSEEDKRKQEELKLEQRRVEERMLRDAYQSSVPPSLIPAMFAWIGGSPLASQTLELAHQQLAQGQQQSATSSAQQQLAPVHASPEARQEGRMSSLQYVPVQAPLAATGGQAAAGQVLPSQSQHQSVYPSPAYQSPRSKNRSMYGAPAQYGPHSAAPRSNVQGSLPRLTTNEPATAAPSSYHQQDQPSPSPSIFFHHWQPPQPGATKDGNKTSPKNSQTQDQTSPPRKRKNTLQHERAPPPASNLPNMSPAFSVASTASAKSRSGHFHPHSQQQHRPHSRTSNYDPIRQERRRNQHDENSPVSDQSRSSRSGHPDERSRNQTPMPRKEEA
ncbi:MAG: hypothetical protein Q9162_004878 [Coniocarpon cinnabarinum]